MLALGWDCGVHLAWAVVRADSCETFVSGGELEAPVVNGALYRRIAEIILAQDLDLVAVEFAEGKAHGEDDPKKAAAKSRCLIHANDVAGFVTGIAHASFSWPRGPSGPWAIVSRSTAPEWRKSIVGQPYPSDAVIARAIKTRVRRVPVCSAHVRDAIGVASYAIAQHRMALAEARAHAGPPAWAKALRTA